MKKIKIDCVLFFALEEEFNIVQDHQSIKLYENKYSYFTFLDNDNNERKCFISYVGEPSSLSAYEFIIKNEILQIFDPSYIIIIGLSGQLSDDINIGDIVIANSIDKYDHEQKILNGDYKFSGKTINIKGPKPDLRRIKQTDKTNYERWQSETLMKLKSLITDEQINNLYKNNYIKQLPQSEIHYGKIATGESVIDDLDIKNKIVAKNRKLLCVDMDSFGFASALKNFDNLIIIRAISDTADGRKKELDNFLKGKNVLRQWSLDNAFCYLDKILFKNFSFNLSVNNNNKYTAPRIEKIDAFIEKHKSNSYPVYSLLFNAIVLEKDTINGQFIYEYLLELSKGASAPIVINGTAGSGKTTLLYTFYKYLMSVKVRCNYIDLHHYRKQFAHEEEVLLKFKSDIFSIIREDHYQILIIDGIDEFERFFINKKINLYYYWQEIERSCQSIFLGVTQQDFDNDDDDTPLFKIPGPNTYINLINFDFSISNIDNILSKLYEINNVEKSSQKLAIKQFFINTNIKEIDWHTVNLLVTKTGSVAYRKIDTLGKFLYRYAKEYFKSSDFNYDTEKCLEESAQIAFSKYIKEQHLTPEQYKSPQWYFIQQSNNIKQFLISEHLISQYKNLKENFNNCSAEIEYVYPYKINSYFKDILNRSINIQSQIYESIKMRYEELELNQKPNVCYILGRFSDASLRIQAKRFLLDQLKLEYEDFSNKKYFNDKDDFRQHLMLLRTIFISLVYLGDKESSQKYLSYILTNKEWDDLNRGFHIEYYGDNKYDPEKLGQHNDDLVFDFLQTYKRLSKRIRSAIADIEGKNYLMFEIELQTITSLAINRFINNKLNLYIKNDLLDILSIIINNHLDVISNQEMRHFISLAYYILKNNKNSILDILKDLYELKKIKRSGWNYKGYINGKEVTRSVLNPESVADHSFGSSLLATLLLPNEIPNEKKYSKYDIIKMLIFHDLAESFTGDKLSFEKNEDELAKEIDQMHIILSLNILNGFGDFSEYKILMDDFFIQKSINGKIAYEIDKIENLLQLNIYADDEINIITDVDDWRNDIIDKIKTPIGKELLRKVLNRKTQNNG